MSMLSKHDIIIHADPKLFLFTDRTFAVKKCDMEKCCLLPTDQDDISYTCSTPVCSRKIHFKCDVLKRKESLPFCPSCRLPKKRGTKRK